MRLKLTTWCSRGGGAQGCDCKRNRSWVRFPFEESTSTYLIFSFLRSGVEAKGKLGTKCLNTRFPLSTLLYAQYSVKLKITMDLIIAINASKD